MELNPYQTPREISRGASRMSLGDIIFYAVAVFTCLFVVGAIVALIWQANYMPLG